MDLQGNLFFDGPAGRIEALLKAPHTEVTRAAVIAHPHPLFGGTMHNKVVYRIAKAFQDAGFAALRFNFRGAGRSAGTHDNGRGEQDDLRAAIGYIEQTYPDAELWLAGFSFGALATWRVGCADARARALALAGLPVSKYGIESLPAACPKPKLIVQGAQDEFGATADLENFFATLEGEKQLRIIESADHFFEGRLDELYKAVSAFIHSLSSVPK
ncbi:MAG: alpha/beta fold hydrolase [Acidobacteriota bacterium]